MMDMMTGMTAFGMRGSFDTSSSFSVFNLKSNVYPLMKTIEVVAAIIHQDYRILATQRGYGDYKGWWEFPGGKM